MLKLSLFLIFFLISIQLQASERPKIGIAFSGGGARGIAHIGVLQALEELKIPIDYIAPTMLPMLVPAI
jgi:NTE family protein